MAPCCKNLTIFPSKLVMFVSLLTMLPIAASLNVQNYRKETCVEESDLLEMYTTSDFRTTSRSVRCAAICSSQSSVAYMVRRETAETSGSPEQYSCVCITNPAMVPSGTTCPGPGPDEDVLYKMYWRRCTVSCDRTLYLRGLALCLHADENLTPLRSQSDAAEFCANIGGALPEADTDDDLNDIRNAYPVSLSVGIWTSAKRPNTGVSYYTWASGKPLSSTSNFWGLLQPTLLVTELSVGLSNLDNKLFDTGVLDTLHTVCMLPCN